MQEVWKDIVGCEGCYQVSNLGNVKALRRVYYLNGSTRFTEEKILKHAIHKDGYLTIATSINGLYKTRLIHRLVAHAFIPNKENKKEINHIDGDKRNNKVENLEWITRSENIYHALKNGLIIPKKRGEHPMAKIIIDLNTGIFYDCMKDAADAINMNYSNLRNRLDGTVFNNTSLRYA